MTAQASPFSQYNSGSPFGAPSFSKTIADSFREGASKMTELTMPDLLKDDKERGKFFVNANNIAKSKNVPANQAHTWIHNELGITTLKDWKGTPAEALKILSDAPEWKPEDEQHDNTPQWFIDEDLSIYSLPANEPPGMAQSNHWGPFDTEKDAITFRETTIKKSPPPSAPQGNDAVDIDEALGRKPASRQPKFTADAWAAWSAVTAKKTELTQAQIFELICEQLQLTGKPVIARPSEFDGTLEELAQVFEDSYIRTSKPMPGDVSQKPPQELPAPPQPSPDTTMRALSGVTTITGIDIVDIPAVMNKRYAPEAYSPIPYGAMAGKTDLGFEHARKRMDDVFGVHGFGWKLEPHPTLGKVIVKVTHKIGKPKREGEKGREYDEYNVVMEMWVFKYRVRLPDGSFDWVEASPMSDEDSNEEQGYAYRGAFTSLLKQALRSLGGMDHILMGQYTHEHAARDKNRKAA